jgi:hypothetical protein
VPFSDGPDNHPYEVIDKTAKRASLKIDRLNEVIKRAKENKTKIFIRKNFAAALPAEKAEVVEKDNLRF